MTATDPAPFRLRRNTRDLPKAVETLAKALPARDLKTVLADANRTAVRKGSTSAFGSMSPKPADWYCFEEGDDQTTDWYPQGVAASAEAGRPDLRTFVVSWYWRPEGKATERGVRLSFLSAETRRYRHVLLVEPKVDGSYAAVNIHAGGVAWYGDLLYVADTSRGFRVFDLRRIFEVKGDDDKIGKQGGRYHAFGYRYVMPQVDAWAGTGSARFSFAAVDRSTTPHSLISGEYVDPSDDPGVAGRVARWPLAPDGTPVAGTDGTAAAADAFTLAGAKIQGALSHKGAWYLSQAASSTVNGSLLVVPDGRTAQVRKFPVGPEDLTCWGEKNQLWCVTEFKGRRALFTVPL
ncbi:hypothetical protein Ssi03_59990 [Sphaerisporangium siamense]|uniref:Secreted protein n=1 Tax=Sphaerisporangium siamense TaxID=795645 RepID=A0A7W7DAF2_9ACTN|nr:hypothetical protein [Sphaerisporangium siamense]MBB4703232.1 hypothetical protein [Sphaerisporangium siamense]GII88009.1 hypothetical protein Ssi03_59990 [Sphaerisporangium siamense]